MKTSHIHLACLFAATFSLPALAGDDAIPVDDGEPVAQEAAPEEAPSAEEGAVAEEASTPTAPVPVPAPATVEAAKSTTFDFIAEANKRVDVRDGDFSMQPPPGWEVYVNLPSLSLLMQVPHTQGEKYQRTIQVASFSGQRYIDEVTAKEYEDVIVRKFSVASASMEDYRIRNHMTIEMADGRQGLLFYTEFKIDGIQLMQAHILVSSQTRHYLMTYSDLAEHFESDAASQFLTEAWESMISVQLSTKTPSRFESAAYIGLVAGIFALFGIGIFVFRQIRSGRQYRDFANGKEGDLDGKSGVSSLHSGVSSLHSGVSQVRPSKGKKKGQKDVSDVQAMASRFTGDNESLDDKDDIAV